MTKPNLPHVENDFICLRLLERDDLPLTLLWRNNDNIRKWFVTKKIISATEHYQWFEKYKELDNDFIFMIISKELGNIPVGQVSIYNINWVMKKGEYGRLMIGEPSAIGKGYAKSATKLVISVGFGNLNLDMISLEVYDKNYIAQHIYEECGFKIIGKNNNLNIMSIEKKYI